MRGTERIDPILAKVARLWKAHPDWRFGQLIADLFPDRKAMRGAFDSVFGEPDETFAERLDEALTEAPTSEPGIVERIDAAGDDPDAPIPRARIEAMRDYADDEPHPGSYSFVCADIARLCREVLAAREHAAEAADTNTDLLGACEAIADATPLAEAATQAEKDAWNKVYGAIAKAHGHEAP